jgi:hypothetical protein
MAAHLDVAGVVRLDADMAAALWYFTPEGEREYVPGWEPEYLHPGDGVLQEGLTFRTEHGDETTIWFVSRYDPAAGAVDYIRLTPGSRVGRVTVRLTPLAPQRTEVTIAYALTSLSLEGDRRLERFATEFDGTLEEWERTLASLIARR